MIRTTTIHINQRISFKQLNYHMGMLMDISLSKNCHWGKPEKTNQPQSHQKQRLVYTMLEVFLLAKNHILPTSVLESLSCWPSAIGAKAPTVYPLVNSHITMENHHVQWENPL